jgi:hypothetical protein
MDIHHASVANEKTTVFKLRAYKEARKWQKLLVGIL